MSKAGSSAIQQSLIENKSALADTGICYPKTGRWGNAHYKLLNDLRRGQHEQWMAKALAEAGQKNIVLSCEGFWLIQDEELKALSCILEGYDVRVILYLRRSSDYAASSYRQSIKHDGETCTPEVYWHRGHPHPHLNYSNQLERWAHYFPLRVRAYEAVKHAMEEDFMRAIGAPLERVDTGRQVTNVTPSDGVMQAMLIANRFLPEMLSQRVRQWVRRTAWRFDFMPPLEDDVLREQAKTVVNRWNMDVMRKYVPENDLALLLADDDMNLVE